MSVFAVWTRNCFGSSDENSPSNPHLFLGPHTLLQILNRLLDVCLAEDVPRTDDGLEALVFTAQGDMRQAINNLQSTFAGFGLINSDNVFKVSDE